MVEVYHFMARMLNRYTIFGSYLLELKDLKKVKPITLLQFARTSKATKIKKLVIVLSSGRRWVRWAFFK